MVLQLSYFRSGFRIGQRIVGQYFIDFWISYMFRTKDFLGMVFVWLFIHQVSSFKACVRYFSLFLKEQCSFWLFRTKYFEKKFNLQLFYLPTVSRTFILSWATTCYPSPRNFLFWKNNCMCNPDNARDVAVCLEE